MLSRIDFAINFNPGAGGNWLAHLIWLLQNPYHNEVIADSVNFHNHPQNESTEILHYSAEPANDIPVIRLGGFCRFNFFLNYVDKVFYNRLDTSDREQLADLMRSAHGQYPHNQEQWELDYVLAFSDPETFKDDLFRVLSEKNITHKLNHGLVLKSMDKFRSTCVDPRLHFDNMDSISWVTWCGGNLMNGLTGNIEDINGEESWEDLRQRVLKHRDYLLEYTESLTLFTR